MFNFRKVSDTLKNTTKNAFFGDKAYLWLCFGVPVAVMYLIYLALGVHPFGEASVLVLDLNAQYVYFYEYLREFIHGDQSLLYAFSRQLGGEFMGIYAYYLASPLSYIVALFPKGKMLEALLSIFLLKTGLCGLTFGLYLHKTTIPEERKKTSIIAFSIMYALCAYAIVHQSNSMWIDALIWLPILTYAIEELIKHGRFKLFVVALAMTIMSNYYIGYMVCFYVALYFFFYYIANSENGKNNSLGEKSHFVKSLLRIGGYSVLAIGISAVIVLTAYYSLRFGKLEFDETSWDLKIRMDLMDLLTKFLPGSYDTVRRSGMPFVYCGVLTLLMLPVYYLSDKVSNREKTMSVVIMSVFIVSFMVNVIDLVWHGFSEPNWLNYRYSFMLSFLMLIFAYKGFNDVERVGNKVPFAMAGFISLFLIVAQKYVFPSYNSEEGAKLDIIQCIGFTFIALVLYLSILGAYKKPEKKQAIAILMVFVVSIEMFANGISNVAGFSYDVVYSSYASYNDFINGVRPIASEVQAKDTSFYRMEKINHRNTNDNMALNMRGLSNSSSTLNSETVGILRQMGYFSGYHKSTYIGGNPVSDSLLGLRYILASNEAVDPEDENIDYEIENTKGLLGRYYELYTADDKYNAYYNPNALSIAFGVSGNILNYKFTDEEDRDINCDPYKNLNEMISAMLGYEETLEIFEPIKDVEFSTSNLRYTIGEDYEKYTPKEPDSRASILLKFTAEKDGDVYFHIPSNYHRSADITVNGKDYGSHYDDDTTRGFYLGHFEKGEAVSVKITLTASELYLKSDADMLYYLDNEAYEMAFDELAKTQMTIDADYKEDHLTGTITTSADSQTILTTIPYDEGWIVKVDGEKIEINKALDSFISFEIGESGDHTIEFIYRSNAFVYGSVCSIVCLIIFILLIVFEKRIYAMFHKKEEQASSLCEMTETTTKENGE